MEKKERKIYQKRKKKKEKKLVSQSKKSYVQIFFKN